MYLSLLLQAQDRTSFILKSTRNSNEKQLILLYCSTSSTKALREQKLWSKFVNVSRKFMFPKYSTESHLQNYSFTHYRRLDLQVRNFQ